MKSTVLLTLVIASLLPVALAAETPPSATNEQELQCKPGHTDIELPNGFCAIVVADSVGAARRITVDSDGDIYVSLSEMSHGGGIVALRDTTGDGKADVIEYFGDYTATGIRVHNGYLYFSPNRKVLRYKLEKDRLVPDGDPQVIVKHLPEQQEHAAKSFAFDASGHIYVNIGAPSNSCQKADRQPHSPGLRPCPYLEHHGIWRFEADETGQTLADGIHVATGIRNMLALAWNPRNSQLYGVRMGRDQLHTLWPEQYTVIESAKLPAEAFFTINAGDNYGWPYCYYDPYQQQLVLAPEYGGNGDETGHCAQYETPFMAFPAHWAPEALLFYTGEQFPKYYQGGAFIAFHGSWNRAPRFQKGYKVIFVPFNNGRAIGSYDTFASGFKGQAKLKYPGNAEYRPVGVAQGPDGSFYIVESQQGKIWRVIYVGQQNQA